MSPLTSTVVLLQSKILSITEKPLLTCVGTLKGPGLGSNYSFIISYLYDLGKFNLCSDSSPIKGGNQHLHLGSTDAYKMPGTPQPVNECHLFFLSPPSLLILQVRQNLDREKISSTFLYKMVGKRVALGFFKTHYRVMEHFKIYYIVKILQIDIAGTQSLCQSSKINIDIRAAATSVVKQET